MEAGRSSNIKIITNARILDLEGEPGRFKVRILREPKYVKEDVCTGCGTCSNYCPVSIIDAYNEGLSKTKAIHIDYQQAIPPVYHIDNTSCLFLTRKECKQCERVCLARAIDFKQNPEELNIQVGAVILSPGFGKIDKEVLSRFGYGYCPDIITGMEFERITSASGPTRGEIAKLSNGKHPEKIAFIQCIGSRDVESGNRYCSSVCCMYAIKEATVAKEHDPKLDIAIFYMDMRTQGKEFDYARIRAEERGIRFIRSRVGRISYQNDIIELSYVTPNGRHVTERFDMVILPEGLESPDDAHILSDRLNIKLNEYDFCHTSILNPLQSSRPGVFVAGAFQGPKDVPESVTDAIACAGMAGELLHDSRNSLIEIKSYPHEMEIEQEPRIGVFVCYCGSNIGAVVNVPKVAEYASHLDNVVFTDTNLYSCSQNAQQLITEKIKENRLNRVVVAACTPRTHEPLFQETLKNAGLNKCLFEMANIRDHCSWVHSLVPEEATKKAMDQVRMAVAKARDLIPLKDESVQIIKKGLVIGGGVAGMESALSIAENGFDCYIIEKEDELGGNLRRLSSLSTGDDPQEFLNNLKKKVLNHPRITVYTNCKIKDISGFVGNFSTTIEAHGESKTLEHGVVIVATGSMPYTPNSYLYGKSDKVITQLEFEDFFNNDQISKLKDVVMIQCVGSRGEDLAYCSKVCCIQAVKNALRLKEKNPSANITIFYRDMRTYGMMEDYYTLAREKGVNFIRFEKEDPPVVFEENESINVKFKDVLLEEEIIFRADMVVLSSGIVPSDVQELSRLLKTPLTNDGFFLEAHPKLRPVESPVDGIFICGIAHSPKPVQETIAQAKAASAKACIVLCKDRIEIAPYISRIDKEKCIGCGICEFLCPYSAIQMIKVGKKKKAETISASCKGCGICASHCPSMAIYMGNFSNEQIMLQIKASVERKG